MALSEDLSHAWTRKLCCRQWIVLLEACSDWAFLEKEVHYYKSLSR